ncbi:hypothetical protein KAX02_13680 [candidate division WOR-3 bacterium]|nr:hypothetical protein [candidate division WOR-3 bacterium]
MIIRGVRSMEGMDVNSEGYSLGDVLNRAYRLHVNRNHKNSYSAVISVTPTGAGDCFFYIKNDDPDMDIVVTSLKLWSASAERIQIKLGDSGTVGGTHAVLTPVSRHGGSGKTAIVTCESGVDITDLSGGNIVDAVDGLNVPFLWEWKSGLIVPKNVMLSLYAVTGAVALSAVMGFYFS